MNSGYTQLSYIYTNGNYVNTGITKNGSADTLKTTISFEFAATSSQTQGLFGSYYSSTREYNQYIGATTGKQ